MLTARLDDSGASTVLVVSVRDRAALEKQLRRRLGTARKSMEGEAELLVSEDEERGAGAFIKGFLIMGRESNVRRCLAAQAQGQTLSASERYRQAQHRLFESAPAVTTFSDDREPARAFINYFSKQKRSSDAAANAETYARAVNQLPLAVSESRFAEDGMERRTRSAFGNFGALVTRFAPEKAK